MASGAHQVTILKLLAEVGAGCERLLAESIKDVADDRRKTLARGRGQKLSNEVVAEFGGAILLECLGYSVESDRGGAYAYIQSYCREHKADVLTTCTDLLDRACAAVALLLATAQELSTPIVSAA
jgi:hypothetical protein